MLTRSDIWVLVVIAVLIVLVLLGYGLGYLGEKIKRRRAERASRHSTSDPTLSDPASASRMLDERLARGEIGEQEYRRRRDELS